VNTFLNCTMPELANISVGSLRGTSGLDATAVWPLRAKKSRKVRRISLAVIMTIQMPPRGPRGKVGVLIGWMVGVHRTSRRAEKRSAFRHL
jgi:hypothetical protein